MLYAYTRNAARALGEQSRIGSIGPGKQADFALLDEDILTVTAEEARYQGLLDDCRRQDSLWGQRLGLQHDCMSQNPL